MLKKILLLVLISTFCIGTTNAEWLGWKRLIDKPTFDVSVNPKNYNTIFVGGEGRLVYRSYDKGLTWDTLEIGYRLGSTIFNNILVHPNDTNIVIVGGLKFGVLARSTNHGKNWDYVISTTSSLELNGKSLMFKPDGPDTVYLGEFRYGKIFRSIDRGKTWDSISQIKMMRKYRKADSTVIDTLMPVTVGSTGIRHDSTNILLVGTTSGEMFLSDDGGINWKRTAVFTSPKYDQQDCEITRITFSNRDPKVGFAVITYLFPMNKNNGGCYKTTDGGYNWSLAAFPDTSMWAVDVRKYGNNDEVFVGGYTEDFYAHDSLRVPGVGIVRRSQDGGKTWWTYDQHIDWALKDPKSNATLRDVFFRPNSDTAFACGQFGTIFKTTDKGENWNNVLYPGETSFRGIEFSDHKNGVVVGDFGKISRSVNGGWEWQDINSGTSESIYGIHYLDPKNLLVCGTNGLIMSSQDSGKSWGKVSSYTSKRLHRFSFANANIGFLCGANGILLKTTDAGKSWVEVGTASDIDFLSVAAIDSNTVFICGDHGLLMKSVNGGKYWETYKTNTDRPINSITITDKANGGLYVTGDGGLILKTTDNGKTWNQLNSYLLRDLKAINFSDNMNGAVTGQYSTILNTTDGGLNWFVRKWNGGPWANMWSLRFLGPEGNEKLYMASEAGLFVLDYPSYVEQLKDVNDPNLKVVTLPQKNVYFEYLPQNQGAINVSIFNESGLELFRQEYNINGNNVSDLIPADNLNSGVYFLRVTEGNKFCVKKLILQ